MKNDPDAGNRRDRINRACITPPLKPKSFDMALMDDTPFETPQYEHPIVSDLSGRINRRLDFEEQGEFAPINKQEPQIENIKNNSTLRIITT